MYTLFTMYTLVEGPGPALAWECPGMLARNCPIFIIKARYLRVDPQTCFFNDLMLLALRASETAEGNFLYSFWISGHLDT